MEFEDFDTLELITLLMARHALYAAACCRLFVYLTYLTESWSHITHHSTRACEKRANSIAKKNAASDTSKKEQFSISWHEKPRREANKNSTGMTPPSSNVSSSHSDASSSCPVEEFSRLAFDEKDLEYARVFQKKERLKANGGLEVVSQAILVQQLIAQQQRDLEQQQQVMAYRLYVIAQQQQVIMELKRDAKQQQQVIVQQEQTNSGLADRLSRLEAILFPSES